MAMEFIQHEWELSRILKLIKFFEKINRFGLQQYDFFPKPSSLQFLPPLVNHLSLTSLAGTKQRYTQLEGRSKSWQSEVVNCWKKIWKLRRKIAISCSRDNLPILWTLCSEDQLQEPLHLEVFWGGGVGGGLIYLVLTDPVISKHIPPASLWWC